MTIKAKKDIITLIKKVEGIKMRTVLITGGSRGIGAATVRKFSSEGYKVAFTYKNSKEAAERLSRETGALAIAADSASENDILKAVKKAEETLGNVEILINNAAVSSFSLITDVSLKEWREMFSVNLDAAFLYSKSVLPSMIRLGYGRIINVSSMWGSVGSSCEVCYSATKAALIGFTKALAKEVGPSGITVNAIAPGFIDTDMNSSLDGDTRAAIIDETPIGRVGEPCDVASAALFLASDAASFITGEIMNLSGGFVV